MKIDSNTILSFNTHNEYDVNNIYGPYRVSHSFNLKMAIQRFNELENKPEGETYGILGETGGQIDSKLIKWLISKNYIEKIQTKVIDLHYDSDEISEEIETFELNDNDESVKKTQENLSHNTI